MPNTILVCTRIDLSKERPTTSASLGKASGVLNLLKGTLVETSFFCIKVNRTYNKDQDTKSKNKKQKQKQKKARRKTKRLCMTL